jgi:hypothetical protein
VNGTGQNYSAVISHLPTPISQTNSQLPTSNAQTNSQLPSPNTDPLPERVTVFLATWPANKHSKLGILHHTPDFCWSYSGWKPVDLGPSRKVLVNFVKADSEETGRINQKSDSKDQTPGSISDLSLPFSCRIFESPDGSGHELAVWSMLVGSRAFAEAAAAESDIEAKDGHARNRQVIGGQFWQATKRRIPVQGTKQFIRYSIPMTGDWRQTVEQTSSFGGKWLNPWSAPNERDVPIVGRSN